MQTVTFERHFYKTTKTDSTYISLQFPFEMNTNGTKTTNFMITDDQFIKTYILHCGIPFNDIQNTITIANDS